MVQATWPATRFQIVFVVALAGCSGSSLVVPDAGMDSSPRSDDATVWMLPEVVPPRDGDGRLADIAVALQGHGWDTCYCGHPTRSQIPRDGADKGFLVWEGVPSGPCQEQANAYLVLKAPGTAQALWLDLVLVRGSSDGATIDFATTDGVCRKKQPIAGIGLEALLGNVHDSWKTACVDFSALGTFEAFGFTVNAPEGAIGVDALRFGPSCPAKN